MRLLFAEGCHPLAGTSGPGASGPILALGAPYRPSKEQQPFQAALRDRLTDHNTTLGLPAHAAVPGRSSTSAGPTLHIKQRSHREPADPGPARLLLPVRRRQQLGRDRGQPVSSDYQSPFALTGATIDHVLLKPGDDTYVDLERDPKQPSAATEVAGCDLRTGRRRGCLSVVGSGGPGLLTCGG